jgi:hypothetical protein
MITNYDEGLAAVFGLGTLEVCVGRNDKMADLPYIVINEWSEPQRVGLYNEGDEVTGKATGKKIHLQFKSKSDFEVFDDAVSRIRLIQPQEQVVVNFSDWRRMESSLPQQVRNITTVTQQRQNRKLLIFVSAKIQTSY